MYSKERQKEHISLIRRILVIKPEAGILEVKASLSKQKKPVLLDKDYINRLVNKIRKERASRLDHYTVNKVLAEFQDEVAELKKKLWLIITNPENSERDRISAIRELRNSSKDLFDKMGDAGVFTRKLGEIEIGKGLSQEEQDLIKRVISLNYGKEPEPKTTRPADTGEKDKRE